MLLKALSAVLMMDFNSDRTHWQSLSMLFAAVLPDRYQTSVVKEGVFFNKVTHNVNQSPSCFVAMKLSPDKVETEKVKPHLTSRRIQVQVGILRSVSNKLQNRTLYDFDCF